MQIAHRPSHFIESSRKLFNRARGAYAKSLLGLELFFQRLNREIDWNKSFERFYEYRGMEYETIDPDGYRAFFARSAMSYDTKELDNSRISDLLDEFTADRKAFVSLIALRPFQVAIPEPVTRHLEASPQLALELPTTAVREIVREYDALIYEFNYGRSILRQAMKSKLSVVSGTPAPGERPDLRPKPGFSQSRP